MGKYANAPIALHLNFKFFPSENISIVPVNVIKPGTHLHICIFAHLLIIKFLPHRLHPFIYQVFIVGHQAVNHAFWCKFNNAAGNGLHKLVIVRG